jgi:hypothetical protein
MPRAAKKLAAEYFERSSVASPFNNRQVNEVGGNLKSSRLNCKQKPKKLLGYFKLTRNDEEIVFVLKGQKAKTLKSLVENGEKGCTALEICKTFALRLSEYIRALRSDGLAGGFNLNIITNKEFNPVGWHGRYVLTDTVEILPNKPDDQEQS